MMPNKLKVLVGMIGLGMLLSLVGGLRGSASGWLSFLFDLLLLLGVMKGKEGARNLLMLFAVLGLLTGAFGVILAVIAGSSVAGGGSSSDWIAIGAIVLTSLVILIQNGFALWCLSRRDVQNWMFQRSLGGAA
jgi:hypothetical protein